MAEIPELPEDLLEGIEIILVSEADDELDLGLTVVEDGCQLYTVLSGNAESLPELFARRNRFIRLAMEDPRKVGGPGETIIGPIGDDASVSLLMSYTIAEPKMVEAQNQNMVWSNITQAEVAVLSG